MRRARSVTTRPPRSRSPYKRCCRARSSSTASSSIPSPHRPQPHPLDPFELASRLSYFLWSSAPDDDAARGGGKRFAAKPATLAAAVDRMLATTERSRTLRHEFCRPMAGRARCLVASRRAEASSVVAANRRSDASQEILLYFSDFLTSGRSWFEFPKADVNFVTTALAYFYGEIPIDIDRARTSSSASNTTAIGARASSALPAFWRCHPSIGGRHPRVAGAGSPRNLLCSDRRRLRRTCRMLEGATAVDRRFGAAERSPEPRESIATNPGCAGCHALFDPYGLALEEYDAIGRYRASLRGRHADRRLRHVAVVGNATPTDDLQRARRARGRRLDRPEIRRLPCEEAAHLRSGEALDRQRRALTCERALTTWLAPGETPSIRRLIQALVSTRAFRFRRGEEAEMTRTMIAAVSRRALLRGAGVALTLPWLESLRRRAVARAGGRSAATLSADLSAQRRPRVLAAREQRERRRVAAVLDPRAVRRGAEAEAERRHQPRERLGVQPGRVAARRADHTAVWAAPG